MKHYIGEKVRIGGKLGSIMEITEIKPNGDMTLISENMTFYYQPGDCTLIHVKEYEQLSLF